MNTFSIIIGFAVFVAAALVGWGIAELKGKAFNYKNNAEEDEVEKAAAEQLHKNGYSEMNIGDIKKTISTKGFSA
jgi:hypothetical protein